MNLETAPEIDLDEAIILTRKIVQLTKNGTSRTANTKDGKIIINTL